jgi:hypothetical protein
LGYDFLGQQKQALLSIQAWLPDFPGNALLSLPIGLLNVAL